MSRLLYSFIIIGLLLMMASARGQVGIVPEKGVTLEDTTDDKFHVGDVWEYKTRKGEEASRLTIVKVDQSGSLGKIIHVGVDHLRVLNNDGEVQFEAVPHMPFVKKALEASVTKKVASKQPLPDLQPGYDEFREAFLSGHAGAYSITVAEAIKVMELTFQKGTAPQQ
jgi:hypothetical protein